MKRFLALVLFLLGLLLVPVGAQAKHDPKQTTTNHAHGPHLNPQGNLVGNGDPTWNTSWWWSGGNPVQDSGYTTVSGTMPLTQVGTLTLQNQTASTAYGQTQTCTTCNFDIDASAPLVAGQTYLLTWKVVATLSQGWTWGAPSDPTVCSTSVGATVMTCFYGLQPTIFLPAFATPTPQPPTPTPTPGLQPTATPTPEIGDVSCTLSPIGSAGNVFQTFRLAVTSPTDPGITIGAFTLNIQAIPLNGLPQTVFPPINFPAAGTTQRVFTVRYGPLTTATRYLINYEVGMETRQGEAECGTTVVLQVAA